MGAERVATEPGSLIAYVAHRRRTEWQAKCGMEFCMAIPLLTRRAGLPEFTDEVVSRTDVQAMIQRVDSSGHPDAGAAG
jgi:2-methylcitrate dehydratase PrpD